MSDIHTARLISGHVLDEDYPSPTHLHRHLRQMASSSNAHTAPHSPMDTPTSEQNPFDSNGDSVNKLSRQDTMTSSLISLGGTVDEMDSSDDEYPGVAPVAEPCSLERTITMIGNVEDKAVIVLDDIVDRGTSFIAAAEHMVKNCGANRVYVMGTHGIFSGTTLEDFESCDCIHQVSTSN